MPKGFFTQGLAVLLEENVPLDEIAALLANLPIVRRIDTPEVGWEMSGPALILAFRPEVRGTVTVDVVDRPWPDDMGHPETAPDLFAAWGMGYFGPGAYPGGLQRAVQQSWRWEGAEPVVAGHRAFVRVRCTYAIGAEPDAPVIPEGYDAVDELRFLTSVVQALLRHPKALCYFNPGGEVLLPPTLCRELIDHNVRHGLPFLDVWTNVRMFRIGDGWILMDSIGNSQIDRQDHEVGFPEDRFQPEDVDVFIRNLSLYLLEKGPVIQDGDTTDGPGETRWQARLLPEGVSSPPRDLLRWLPVGVSGVPEALRPQGEESMDEAETGSNGNSEKPWWKVW
jgi:hypothetical protein